MTSASADTRLGRAFPDLSEEFATDQRLLAGQREILASAEPAGIGKLKLRRFDMLRLLAMAGEIERAGTTILASMRDATRMPEC